MSDSGLYDRPVLVLDPGVHTAPIIRAGVDAAGRLAVTGAHDRTVRLWSLDTGALLHTIRVPEGPGNVGKIYAAAISPDGAMVAAGGWARQGDNDIYIFNSATGMIRGRIAGLPNVVLQLAFSPDGSRLAATMASGEGLRVYDQRWAEVARDPDGGSAIYAATFAPDGRLATAGWDGRLHLYGRDSMPERSVALREARPLSLAFSPDGRWLAVGYDGGAEVHLLDSVTGAYIASPEAVLEANGNLGTVAWSADGATLHATGRYSKAGILQLVTWDGAGRGPGRERPAAGNTAMALCPLHGGDLFVAAQDPWLARLAPDGTPRWSRTPQQIDPRGQWDNLRLSADGMIVDFGLGEWGVTRARFDVSELTLLPDPETDGVTAPASLQGSAVSGWLNGTEPELRGARLPLRPHESARSLAMHPNGAHFLLGSEWYLRCFDAEGREIWAREAPAPAWAVNVSRDGRLGLAAYGDGTLRWHRMTDGAEILAVFPLLDRRNWVAWTPEGVYAATPGARAVLRWHVNHGWDEAGGAIAASDIPETHRPEVIRHVLAQLGTFGAIAVAELARVRDAVQLATGSRVAPGARLHVLAVGVSDYGQGARKLALAYAHQDARDVAAALVRSQGGLYSQVRPIQLVNDEATKDEILAALETMRDGMAAGTGTDQAVILFSGHGSLVDGALYLLPYGVDASTRAKLKATALPVGQFRDEIAALAQHGRVLVLIDACRSGAATRDGLGFALDGRALRAMLAGSNVSIFTSSSGEENSIEDATWENGAFTEALLEALRNADEDGDGLLRVSDLSRYLGTRVPQLTGGRQQPGIEIRFDAPILVAEV